MELRQLKTFLTIVQSGSFIQAAIQLDYAQSTITSHIQTLENDLGIRLFDRLGHKVTLTHSGRMFKTYAEKIIQLADEAKEAVAPLDTPHGTLVLGTGESLSTYKIPKLLRAYRTDYPNVEIVVKFANCSTIRDCIRNNEVDVGLIIDRKIEDPDLIVKCISMESLHFLAAPNHPLAKPTTSPQDWRDTCVILTEHGCSYRATIEKTFTEANLTPRSSVEVSSIESIKQFVMLGLGISMLPIFTVEKELQTNQIAAIQWYTPLPNYMVQLVYHKDKWLSPALRAFIGKVDEILVHA